MTTQASTNGSKIVKDLFAAFGRGNLDGVIATFHTRAKIIAVRAGSRGDGQLHGSYEGTDGLFWSGQSFDEPGLEPEGKFKTAELRITAAAQIKARDLKRWLRKAKTSSGTTRTSSRGAVCSRSSVTGNVRGLEGVLDTTLVGSGASRLSFQN